jgi:hypothetical protein
MSVKHERCRRTEFIDYVYTTYYDRILSTLEVNVSS